MLFLFLHLSPPFVTQPFFLTFPKTSALSLHVPSLSCMASVCPSALPTSCTHDCNTWTGAIVPGAIRCFGHVLRFSLGLLCFGQLGYEDSK